MVVIVTDTCACIPDPLPKELDIEVVPYYVHRGGETLRDVVDVSRDEFFRWLPQATELPKTANPGPGDYLAAFKVAAERGDAIVVVSMTSKGSGAHQSSLVARDMARAELPGVEVVCVDTLQVAMSHGWAAIEGARAALSGCSLDQVVATVRDVAARGVMIQTADTLRYLYMGGRIGRAQHFVGSLLNVKPIIGMEDGIIVPLGQARSRPAAYDKMAQLMEQRVGQGARVKVAYMHVAAPGEAEEIRKVVEPRFDVVESLTAELCPALGVHTGPGMVGVSFFPA